MKNPGKDITIHANGINICYDDSGGEGIPLIFIHGFPFDKSMWQPQADFFKMKRRVITYDIRGYGKSLSNKDEETISLYADDLVNLLDVLDIPRVIACGLSMGGYILLDAVNRYRERFEGIVLSDTQCIADSPEAREKRHQTIQQIESEGTTNFAEGFIKNIFCADSLEHKKPITEKIKNVILSTKPATIIATLRALAGRIERCSTLEILDIPTLVICGKEDKITPVVQSEFLKNNIPGSTLALIAAAGHMSNLEQPDIFNSHLARFLDTLTR